jgi:hypothetical protein
MQRRSSTRRRHLAPEQTRPGAHQLITGSFLIRVGPIWVAPMMSHAATSRSIMWVGHATRCMRTRRRYIRHSAPLSSPLVPTRPLARVRRAPPFPYGSSGEGAACPCGRDGPGRARRRRLLRYWKLYIGRTTSRCAESEAPLRSASSAVFPFHLSLTLGLKQCYAASNPATRSLR